MKKIFFTSICLTLSIIFCSCSGFFGHEKYTETSDYPKIFDLSEIRYTEALELFPDDIEMLDVQEFYFEWKLGIVGSADVQFLLSVTYDDLQFQQELLRMSALADGKVFHDTEGFAYEAYVLLLGYHNTSYYALVDGHTIHYVLLQLMDQKDIDIDADFLPIGYEGLGNVKNASYSVYE